ncbi:hypothetical protein M2137_000118 [Parabacteroides sp. PFB2-10]|uniref:porin family protein n=1 Tax=Parabacteroides sp. PFB2-10 TaxID=1742405 RepID=UPI002474DAE8|nr:porin family protein [Parabacteroides sp. PFB2-10]MDH6311368.1 hypothetical protein [Parabacteroides sp. PFB2-10]MDL2245974.1 outer membrane beta-barrel protein [Parabacteroides sp. OttesenSCG-928-J18]
MSDKVEHNDLPDPFSSYLKGRLEDHRMPVEPDLWESLESRLNERKKGRTGWIIGLLAAALLTGMLWIFFPQTESEEPVPALAEQPKTDSSTSEVTTTEVIEEPITVSAEKEKVSPRSTGRLLAAVAEKEEPTAPHTISDEEPIAVEPNEKEEPAPKKEEADKRRTPTPEREPAERRFTSRRETVRKKREGNWLVAAAVGTGQSGSLGFFSTEQTLPQEDFSSGGSIPIPNHPAFNTSSGLNSEDFTDIDYALPLSFGLVARIPINRTWAIESGLVYTYLSTKMSGHRSRTLEGQVELHYLGIPVNLVANVWNQGRWNAYLSGGVMIEKGLNSIYTERRFYGNRIENVTGRTRIGGVQWSLNGAVGLSYRFYNNWSLYGEPKVYYYFDNNQPISSRTEKPFGFGIGAGVRYQF